MRNKTTKPRKSESPSAPPEPSASQRQRKAQPYGSTLGIIDSDPNAKLAWTPEDHGGNPKGIEVQTPGAGSTLKPFGLGSTTDMGAGGDGNEVARADRPKVDD
ncbi:MAG: hypothetical protein ABI039_12605 [Vicinamibacterales bacterium]